MDKNQGTGQRPERPKWDSFWDRPVPDGIDDFLDDFLRERFDVVQRRRFEPSDDERESDTGNSDDGALG